MHTDTKQLYVIDFDPSRANPKTAWERLVIENLCKASRLMDLNGRLATIKGDEPGGRHYFVIHIYRQLDGRYPVAAIEGIVNAMGDVHRVVLDDDGREIAMSECFLRPLPPPPTVGIETKKEAAA